MAGITAMGTTYNLPNYTGLLYGLTPEETPFFSAIGGLNGGMQTDSTEFEWGYYDLRAAGQNVQLEGATAPTAQERVRANGTNVTQIHQEKVSVSYSRQGAVGLKAGTNNAMGSNVPNELDWQTEQMLKQMVRDVEYSFMLGVYNKPTDNTTKRQTRGIIPAITTNLVGNSTRPSPGCRLRPTPSRRPRRPWPTATRSSSPTRARRPRSAPAAPTTWCRRRPTRSRSR
jgi:hypothetical protein